MHGVRPNRLLLSNLPLGIRKSIDSTFLYALVVIASLALPANALAGASDSRKQPGTSAEFTVPGTNGYSLYVKSEKREVTVTAANHRPLEPTISPAGRIRPANTGNAATSSYLAFGSPQDPNTIEADLGPLGKISVAFQPSGETRVTMVNLKDKSRKCVGAERIVRHLGTFTGTIEFQGEGDYTTVNASSAEGTVGTSLFRDCTTNHRGASASTTSSAHGSTDLIASNRRGSNFFASALGDPRAAGFFASTLDVVAERVIVVRLAQAVAGRSSFVFNDALSSATLTPPAPFSGSGQFRRVRGGPSSWTGSLSVAFPGKTVSLTGPPFHARLTHSQ